MSRGVSGARSRTPITTKRRRAQSSLERSESDSGDAKAQENFLDHFSGNVNGGNLNQTISGSEMSVHADSDEIEHFRFFTRPRSISTLMFTLLVIFYWSAKNTLEQNVEESPLNWKDNLFFGFKGACFLVLITAAVSFPDGPFVRPHPMIWRLVLGVLLIYWIVLVFVLFMDYQDIRATLAWLYPELTPERWNPNPLPWVTVSFLDSDDYASDCTINYENLASKFDVFILCHFLGWAAKGLMLRNYTLCWIMSIFWEITELFYAYILPNFTECWWDQWLFDVILCNGLGIWIGVEACRFLEVKSYEWHYDWKDLTGRERVKAAVYTIIRPQDWMIVRWEPLTTPKRYVVCIIMVLINNVVELNAFILKNIFEIPSPHKLNIFRLLFWASVCLPACRQVYQYAIDESVSRLGTYAWCGFGCAVTELLVGIKFGFLMKQPVAPWPIWKTYKVTFYWLLTLTAFTTVCMWIARQIERSKWFQKFMNRKPFYPIIREKKIKTESTNSISTSSDGNVSHVSSAKKNKKSQWQADHDVTS